MCYAATHPEKMDQQKQVQWQKLAKLQPADMATIINLEHLGVPVRKRGTGLRAQLRAQAQARRAQGAALARSPRGAPPWSGRHPCSATGKVIEELLPALGIIRWPIICSGRCCSCCRGCPTDTVRLLQVQRTSWSRI